MKKNVKRIKKEKMLLFLLLFVLGMAGCRRDKEMVTQIEETPNSVSVMTVDDTEIQEAGYEESTDGTKTQEHMDETEEQPEGTKTSKTENSLAVPSTSGALHLEGTNLLDCNGDPVQLRGISTHGLSWFPQYVNQECFEQLRNEWNVNIVRLAMYTAEGGGYCSDGDKEALKQLIRDGVEYAANADLYVIIDWHILSDSNPKQNKEEAKKFFEEMSGEFCKEDHVLYEICNEPNGGTTWADIKAYAEEIIPVIRANDKDAVIIVGTPTWSQDVDQAAADPITEYDNIMYALHFYAATHTEWLREKMEKAVEAGLPIFVTEFGICDASGNGAIDDVQADTWIDELDRYGISYVAWNLSNKAETSALLRPECSKTSGFTAEDLSESGTWIFEMLTADKSQSAIQGSSDGITYTASVSNSWEENGKVFYQYMLTLENSTEQDLTGWAVEVVFNEEISLSNGWNGEYTVNGCTLTITSKDYNARVSAGDKVSEIGFIVGGSRNLKIVSE